MVLSGYEGRGWGWEAGLRQPLLRVGAAQSWGERKESSFLFILRNRGISK